MSDYAGTLKFDTSIDSNSFNSGLGKLGSLASKGLGAAAKVVGSVSAGVTAFGTASLSAGNEFYAGMSQVEAISGASAEELNQLTEMALKMGAETKFSATESAEAFNYMAMAGWKTEDMLNGIEGIMSLAAASGEDLGTTSDIVTDALTAFGLTAADSGHFADILAAASSNANTNVSLMGETFKYVAPVAGAMGYSAEDLSVAIGLMANAGIKGSQAGTSLRGMLTRLAKPTKEVDMAMTRLGISLNDGEGNMKSFREIMTDLREGFGDIMLSSEDFHEELDALIEDFNKGNISESKYNKALEELISQTFNAEDAEKARTAAMLAGQEGMSGLLAIVNASDEDFEKLVNSIDNCTGSAKEMAETMQNNLQGDVIIMKSALEGLQIAFYNTFGDNLRSMVQQATGYIDQMKEALNDGGFEGFAQAAGDAVANMVSTIASKVPSVVDIASKLIIAFCDSIDKNAVSLAVSGTNIIVSLVHAILKGGSRITASAIRLMALLITGLAEELPQIMKTGAEAVKTLGDALVRYAPVIFKAAISIIKQLTQGLANNLPQLIPVAMQAIMEFSGHLRSAAGQLFDAGLQLIVTLAEALIDNIPVFIETVPTIITNLCGIINDNAPKLIEAGLKLIIELAAGLIQAIPVLVANIPQIIKAIVSAFTAFNWVNLGSKLITMMGNGVKALASLLPTLFKNISTKAVTVITAMVAALGSKCSELPGIFANHLQNVLTKTITWGSNMVQRASNAMSNMLSTVTNWVSQLPGRIQQHLSTALTNLITWGSNMVQRASAAMSNMLSTITNWVSQLPGRIQQYLSSALTNLITWGSSMVQQASSSMSSMLSTIANVLSQLPGKFSSTFSSCLSTLASFASSMISKGQEAAQGFFNSIVNGLSSLPSKMSEIGSNIVSGIWNGISSGWSWLQGQVSSLANSLLSTAKSALGISSPSKAFRDEVGQWIPAGIVAGVHRSMPKAVKDMKSEMSSLVSSMQGSVAMETTGFGMAAGAAMSGRVYGSAGTTIYNDNRLTQENTYNVPTATPSEVNKAQREAFRNFAREVN